MKVIVIRHGKVDFRRSCCCEPAAFDRECAAYDQAPLKTAAYTIPQGEFKSIYVSTLPRSRETARLMFPGKDLQESELIHEVPCRSAFDSKIRLPLWLWFLIGRLQWAAGSRKSVATPRTGPGSSLRTSAGTVRTAPSSRTVFSCTSCCGI